MEAAEIEKIPRSARAFNSGFILIIRHDATFQSLCYLYSLLRRVTNATFQPGAFESMIDSAGAEFTPAKYYCVARARGHINILRCF